VAPWRLDDHGVMWAISAICVGLDDMPMLVSADFLDRARFQKQTQIAPARCRALADFAE